MDGSSGFSSGSEQGRVGALVGTVGGSSGWDQWMGAVGGSSGWEHWMEEVDGNCGLEQ